MRRLLRAIRVDITDAITAIRMGEWQYALPACIFRRLPDTNPVWLTLDEQIEEDTCSAHRKFCCPSCFNMNPCKD